MSIAFNKVKTALGMDDVLPFGRHQGYTVEEILKDRPEYIAWLIENTSLKFYPSVHNALIEIALRIDRAYKPRRRTYFYTGGLRGDMAHYDAELDARFDDWDSDAPF